VETYRQERVAVELSRSRVVVIDVNVDKRLREYAGVTEGEIREYKAGMKLLLKVSEGIQKHYNGQIGVRKEFYAESLTSNDRELIRRHDHPWCTLDTSPFCVAVPSLPARRNLLYPENAGCEKTREDLQLWGSPFSVLAMDDAGNAEFTPYAKAFDQSGEAELLRRAAVHFYNIPREKKLAEYLAALADALESDKIFPYIASDKLWHETVPSGSLLLVRAGADETGGYGLGDTCESRALFHFNLGLKNLEAAKGAEEHSLWGQKWEDGIAGLVGDEKLYGAHEAAISLPWFHDIIMASGDNIGGGAVQNAIGQTLPNWCGSDGLEEPCPRSTMVFVNKTELAYAKPLVDEYIMPLFSPEQREFFAVKAGAMNVLFHEEFHNFGPQSGKPKPGTAITYEMAMKDWGIMIEELKAEVGGCWGAGTIYLKAKEDFKTGLIDAEKFSEYQRQYKEMMTFSLTWTFRQVANGLAKGDLKYDRYSCLSAVVIGYLTETGVIEYDESGGFWNMDFESEEFQKGIEDLLAKILKYYVSSDVEGFDAFVKGYMEDGGKFHHLHAETIKKVAGEMPLVISEYRPRGL